MEPDLVLVGFVVGLDYENPYLNPYKTFQQWKHHKGESATHLCNDFETKNAMIAFSHSDYSDAWRLITSPLLPCVVFNLM